MALLLFCFSPFSSFAQSSGTYTFANNENITTNITLTGHVTYDVPAGFNATVSGVISGNFSVTKTGAGTLIFTGNNTYNVTSGAATTISSGYLRIGNGGTTGSVTGNIINNSTLSFYHSNSTTFSGVISGTGVVEFGGTAAARTVTLTGNNTYSGHTIIGWNVTLALGTGGSIENSSTVDLTVGSKINITAGNKKIKAIYDSEEDGEIILGSNTLTIGTAGGSDGEGSFYGTVTGTGGITKTGTGHFSINPTNAVTATFTCAQGEVSLHNWTGSLVTQAASTLYVNGNINLGGTLTMQGGTTKFYLSGTTPSKLTVTGSLSASGSNTIVVTGLGSASSYPLITANSGVSTSTFTTTIGSLTASSTTLTLTPPSCLHQFSSTSSGNINIPTGTTCYFNVTTQTAILSGVISGSGNCVIIGGGILILTGENTHTGTITVENGYLQIGNGGSTGRVLGNIILNNSSELWFRRADYTYGGIISGTGHVRQNSNSKLTLTGVNTYTGNTSVNEFGTLQIGNGTSGSIANTSQIYLYRATLRCEPSATSPMTINAPILGSGIVGTCRFEKGGPANSVLYLTANDNQVNGTTTVESGYLYIGNGGTTGGISGNVVVNENALLGFYRTTDYTYSGVISGQGTVDIEVAGAITFSGVNTYTGTTRISGGTLRLSSTGSIENSGLWMNRSNSVFDISEGNKKIKWLDDERDERHCTLILGNKTLTIGTAGENDGWFQWDGYITGTGGSIIKTGLQPCYLSQFDNRTATGTFTCAQGDVFVQEYYGDEKIWAGDFVKQAGATLYVAGNVKIGGTLTMQGGETIFDLTSNDWQNPAKLSVTGNFIGGSPNTISVSAIGVNSSLPIITANSGITSGAFNTTFGTLTATSNTLTLNPPSCLHILTGGNSTNYNIPSGTTCYFNTTGADVTLSGNITGGGNMVKLGYNQLRITGTIDITGTTTIEDGYLCIGYNTPTGSIAGNIITKKGTMGTSVVFNRNNEYTYTGVISGPGTVQLAGGKTILTGVNTYTGQTGVSYGTLQIGNGISGSINNTSAVSLYYTTSILRFEPGTNTTFSKKISGSGGVQYKGGTGKDLTFTADNTYTGSTTIEDGGLHIGNGGTTGAIAGAIVCNKATSIVSFNRSNPYTYGNIISGPGDVGIYGTGAVTFNSPQTYTGLTDVTSTLILGSNGSIATSSYLFLSGTFDISAGDKTVKGLQGESWDVGHVILGSKTLTIGTAGQNDGIGIYSGLFSGAGGSVTKTGTGTFTLETPINNSATGTFTCSQGTVVFGSNWNGNFVKQAASTLTVAGNSIIGGTLTLQGGTTNFSLSGTTPSKLSVTGAFQPPTGSNIFNIIGVGTATNYQLITAASGCTTTTITTAGIPGTLSANATTITFTSTPLTCEYNLNNGTTHSANITLPTGSSCYFNVPTNGTAIVSGKISGSGELVKTGEGKLILTNANDYTGATTILQGTLQIGNGSAGSIATTSGVAITSGATLRFEPGANMTFSKVISGDGKVEYKGGLNKALYLTANNTYTGNTSIVDGDLWLGNGGNAGDVKGIIYCNNVNSRVIFDRSNPHTFSGVITGLCSVRIYGAGAVTFSAPQTYTGVTELDGTLNLTSTSSLANSELLISGTFDISATTANPTIKSLQSKSLGAGNVILGSRALNIGTAGENNGDGNYSGLFSGTGGVNKNGTGVFTLNNNNNSATGQFFCLQGTVVFGGKWNGAFSNRAGAILTVDGNPTISGILYMQGGTTNFNLSGTTPSKLTVNGALSTTGLTGVNTLNISAVGSATSYQLITITSGGTTTGFTTSGVAGTLSATSTALTFTPTPLFVPVTNITGVPTAATATVDLTLTGTVVPGNATNQAIVWSVFAAGTTGATISGSTLNTLSNGTVTVRATIENGATQTTPYIKDFDIVVSKATLGGTPTITGNAVFGQTLTAGTTGLNSTPTIPGLGTLSYQWRRGTTNITGATGPTYALVQADIGQTINVQVTASNCTGTVTSASTGTVTKAPQTAPAQPTLASSTSTSITLNTVTGCEYNMNSGLWQPSPVFGGLTPSTTYTFTQRYAETATHYASPASAPYQGTTPGPEYVPVTNITGVPTAATATVPLTLTGTVVPSNATNQAIVWSVYAAGTTGATISGSTLNTLSNGTVTVRATIINGETQTTPYIKDFDIVVSKATLGGTVSITGNTVFGQPLTAVTSLLTSTPVLTNLGTFTYQWKRGGTNISGATSATYTLVQADITAIITVEVTASNCTGTVLSSGVGPVTKAPQAAPVMPTMASNTNTSITLNTVAGCEYKREGGAFQDSPEFTGLTANTSYLFTQRLKETATHFASPESPAANLSTTNNEFIPISHLTNLPTLAHVGVPFTLTATVNPSNATYQDIVWKVIYAGNTGATITNGNILNTTAKGNIMVLATIENGLAIGTPFTFEFSMAIEELGIDEPEWKITVYPNPTRGELTIDNGQLTINNVEIYDIYGKKIFEEKENLTVLRSYNLTVLPKGIYFLKISTEKGIVVQIVVKN